jgi:hypothetical protein
MSQSLPGRNDQPHIQQADLDQLFSRLDPREVEQFYQFYHTWQQQGRVDQLINEIETLQWRIAENDVLLRQAEPSTMVQADIALLETRGVVDIDLLDRMVGRGEIWLNRTIDLLQRCEELNMIGETYEAWCEHALEGAYEWISTMEENADSGERAESDGRPQDTDAETIASPTEDAFIQRLMSEENEAAGDSEVDGDMGHDDGEESFEEQDESNSVESALAAAANSDQSEQEPPASSVSEDNDQGEQVPASSVIKDGEQNEQESPASGIEDDGQNEQEPVGSDDNGEDSGIALAQQAEEDGIADIEVQSAEDLEIEAQQVADFEQQPVEDVAEDNAEESSLAQDTDEAESSAADDPAVNTEGQAEDLHKQAEGDRHWPYILNAEEVEKDGEESATNPQSEQTEEDEQEPQSLVQKLLTKVLRW